jgi:hypothetical protein
MSESEGGRIIANDSGRTLDSRTFLRWHYPDQVVRVVRPTHLTEAGAGLSAGWLP